MRSIKMVMFSGLTTLLCLSCATAPKIRPEDVQKKFHVEVPFDVAWTAVIGTFADLNLPIANLEKDSGLIMTDWVRFPEDFCDCGSAPLAIEISRQGKFNVFVKREGTGVSLTVNTTYEVVREVMDTRANVRCVSTGRLEQTIHERVQAAAR